ncbi:Rrf2 family transcriptional regulator [Magnetospirillum sp. UT-4]|uniref:RrF2 family transcriptional regulator n=1 Tax=Magnetospirillum sp. UT-4 TaxID=2681467 RepID=UPI00137DE4D2|nr:Rrf2 family transcriptional regulator [Magnetospirillum sp. UT-4]CAA7625174.1 Rrf2-like transcriptional regulator protein [Magnetospirillum sp. UT-4]
MRLTLHTDYALRVLVHVGLHTHRLVTITEIAECHGISKNHLTKVVHQLGRSGFLETVRGKYGGVRLQVEPDAIRLGDFVRRVEEDFAIARCLREGMPAEESCRLAGSCVAKTAFSQGIAAFFQTLDRFTLADMIAAERGGALVACG